MNVERAKIRNFFHWRRFFVMNDLEKANKALLNQDSEKASLQMVRQMKLDVEKSILVLEEATYVQRPLRDVV